MLLSESVTFFQTGHSLHVLSADLVTGLCLSLSLSLCLSVCLSRMCSLLFSLSLTHSFSFSLLFQVPCWTSLSISYLVVSTRPEYWMRPALLLSWKRSWKGWSTFTKMGRFTGESQDIMATITVHRVMFMSHHPLLSEHAGSKPFREWMSMNLSSGFHVNLTYLIFNTLKMHNWGGLLYIKVSARNTVNHRWLHQWWSSQSDVFVSSKTHC